MKRLWLRLFQVFGREVSRFMEIFRPRRKGLIDSKLAKVETSDDLFTFFHFARRAEEKRSDGKYEIVFRPTGEAFAKLVTLRVVTDDRGVIQQISLSLARPFIDDRKQCVYAADLAQSFLLQAAHSTKGDSVQSLAAEIQARSIARSARVVIMAQPVPNLPGDPSPAYLTYAGGMNPLALSYGSGQHEVSLQNEPDDGLVITVK